MGEKRSRCGLGANTQKSRAPDQRTESRSGARPAYGAQGAVATKMFVIGQMLAHMFCSVKWGSIVLVTNVTYEDIL